VGNVGTPSCAVKLTHFNGYFITEDSFKIPAATIASGWAAVLAYLKAAALASMGNRIFPIHNVGGYTDNTPAPEEKKNGFGDTVALIEKAHSWDVELDDMGYLWWANLRKFNGRKDLRVIELTPEVICGSVLSNGDFVGHKATTLAKQVKVGNKTDITKYTVALTLKDPKALTDKIRTIAIPDEVTISDEVMGILNVNLALIGTATATSAKVTVTEEISKISLYDEYSGSSQLGAAAAWVATNSVTGATVTVTGVTAVPATKSFTLAYATQTNPVTISLATPSVLAATPLFIGGGETSGFESDTVDAPVA
jgi:hypothetical protein